MDAYLGHHGMHTSIVTTACLHCYCCSQVHGYEDEDDAQIIPSTKRVEVEGHGIKVDPFSIHAMTCANLHM